MTASESGQGNIRLEVRVACDVAPNVANEPAEAGTQQHMKAERHLGRCYLKGRAGDAINVILSAVGYNLASFSSG